MAVPHWLQCLQDVGSRGRVQCSARFTGGPQVAISSHPGVAGGRRGIPSASFRGHQPMCATRETSHDYAKRHPTCEATPRNFVSGQGWAILRPVEHCRLEGDSLEMSLCLHFQRRRWRRSLFPCHCV